MAPYLDNGHDVMNYFAKFEKFLPHSIIIASFLTIESQIPELDPGGLFCPSPPPNKIGSQNTPYKLGLILLLVLSNVRCFLQTLIIAHIDGDMSDFARVFSARASA